MVSSIHPVKVHRDNLVTGIVHQVKESAYHSSAIPTTELTETQLQSLSTASGIQNY